MVNSHPVQEPTVPTTFSQQANSPPIPPSFQNISQREITTTPPMWSSGSVTPSDTNVSSIISNLSKTWKKFGGGKTAVTILGLFILVGGLGTGVFLTQQQQNIRSKARMSEFGPGEGGGVTSVSQPTTSNSSGGTTTAKQVAQNTVNSVGTTTILGTQPTTSNTGSSTCTSYDPTTGNCFSGTTAGTGTITPTNNTSSGASTCSPSCGVGYECSAGTCVSGVTQPEGVECSPTIPCPTGKVCTGGVCFLTGSIPESGNTTKTTSSNGITTSTCTYQDPNTGKCFSYSSVSSNGTKTTINTQNDSNNCASLGTKCETGTECSNGNCVSTSGGKTAPVSPTIPTTSGYTRDQVVNTQATANGVGYDCIKNGGCSSKDIDVSGYYWAPNGKYYPIGGTGNNPATYANSSLAAVKAAEAKAAAAKAAADAAAQKAAAAIIPTSILFNPGGGLSIKVGENGTCKYDSDCLGGLSCTQTGVQSKTCQKTSEVTPVAAVSTKNISIPEQLLIHFIANLPGELSAMKAGMLLGLGGAAVAPEIMTAASTGSLGGAAIYLSSLPAVTAASNAITIGTVAYTVYGVASGPNSQAGQNVAQMVTTGWATNPAGFTQMLSNGLQMIYGTGAVGTSLISNAFSADQAVNNLPELTADNSKIINMIPNETTGAYEYVPGTAVNNPPESGVSNQNITNLVLNDNGVYVPETTQSTNALSTNVANETAAVSSPKAVADSLEIPPANNLSGNTGNAPINTSSVNPISIPQITNSSFPTPVVSTPLQDSSMLTNTLTGNSSLLPITLTITQSVEQGTVIQAIDLSSVKAADQELAQAIAQTPALPAPIPEVSTTVPNVPAVVQPAVQAPALLVEAPLTVPAVETKPNNLVQKIINLGDQYLVEPLNKIIPGGPVSEAPAAVEAVIPADLTKITIAPDGDTFVSIEGTYQSESPALARRLTDIQNQIPNLDPQKIAQIIYDAKYIDGLTGITNRTGFTEGLDLEIANSAKNSTDLTVVTMDLRNFKDINDKLGHSVGDEALIKVANLLKENARSSDLVIRVGGDEFALVLPQINETQAQSLIQRILADLENQKASANVDDFIQRINIDYGIKQWSGTDTVDGFLKDLDVTMYEQKRGVSLPVQSTSSVAQTTTETKPNNLVQKIINLGDQYLVEPINKIIPGGSVSEVPVTAATLVETEARILKPSPINRLNNWLQENVTNNIIKSFNLPETEELDEAPVKSDPWTTIKKFEGEFMPLTIIDDIETDLEKQSVVNSQFPGKSIDKATSAVIKSWKGEGSISEKLAYTENYSKKSPTQMWLYSPSGEQQSSTYKIQLSDGTSATATYKLHFVARPENYDRVVAEMTAYLRDINILHKISPGPRIVDPTIRIAQYGKVGTIYAEDADTLKLIVEKARELAQNGLSGISPEEFTAKGANLSYERSVPGTNNLLYATVERVNGDYLGDNSKDYAARKDYNSDNNPFFIQGPLKDIFNNP